MSPLSTTNLNLNSISHHMTNLHSIKTLSPNSNSTKINTKITIKNSTIKNKDTILTTTSNNTRMTNMDMRSLGISEITEMNTVTLMDNKTIIRKFLSTRADRFHTSPMVRVRINTTVSSKLMLLQKSSAKIK